MPGGKGFDFFVESSMVEIYNEEVHDMYQKDDAIKAHLRVCVPRQFCGMAGLMLLSAGLTLGVRD